MFDSREVAKRASRGDPGAFRSIVEHTKDRLFRLACRLLGDHSEAEDALQDAYLKAHQALVGGGFSGEATLETWLYRIVTNSSMDTLRRRRARPARPLEASDELAPTDGLVAEARVALRELDEWLGDLPPEQRAVVVLRFVEGMTSGEAAEVLECSEGAVEQRLVRARAALRERERASAPRSTG